MNSGIEAPEELYLIGNLDGLNWNISSASPKASKSGTTFTFTDVKLVNTGGGTDSYFSFISQTNESNDWNDLGTRYGAESDNTPVTLGEPMTFKTGESAFKIPKGTYTISINFATATLTVTGTPESDSEVLAVPDRLYLVGNIADHGWDTKTPVEATSKSGSTFTFSGVNLVRADDSGSDYSAYFSFISAADPDGAWDNVGTRYGSSVEGNHPIAPGSPEGLGANTNSFMTTYGVYDITVDFAAKTVSISGTPGEITGESVPYPLYIVGNIDGHNWDVNTPVAPTSTTGTQAIFKGVVFVKADSDSNDSYFSFITASTDNTDDGTKWNDINASARYGATSANQWISDSGATQDLLKKVNDAGSTNSFKTAAGTYDIVLDFEHMTITITPAVSDVSYTPVINGSSTVKLKGWTGAQPWGGGWNGSEGQLVNLTKDSDTVYSLEFAAEDTDAYVALRDSEGNWFYGSSGTTTSRLGVDESVSDFRLGGDANNRTHLAGMTVGHNYRLTLSAGSDGSVSLSLSDLGQRHIAPSITVSTTTDDQGNFHGLFTVRLDELKPDCNIFYSIDGGVTTNLLTKWDEEELCAKGVVDVTSTSTLSTWVVDGAGLRGDVATATWVNPADVTNPAVKVELLDNSDGGTGAVMLSLTNTTGNTWSGRYAFAKANGKDWNNYYYLRITYKDDTVRYTYLGGTGLNNVDLDETYTETSSPALGTYPEDGKLNGKSGNSATAAGFGVNGANDRRLVITVTLGKDHSQVTSLTITEPEVVNPLPTRAWTLEDDTVWDGATKKYFYLSWNQNDNRVSPEWELLPDGEGNYVIDGFMVIPNGQFRIREIERNGNADGTHKVTDYGWEDANNYTIGISTLGLNAESRSQSGLHTGTATMAADVKRGFRWDVGFSIASVKFNPATGGITYGIDLDKPSTLIQAAHPGLPYVALMGSNVKTPLAEDQSMLYALTLNDNVDNTAYTNAWLQYDPSGSLYVYGDLGRNASIYKVGSEGDVASSATPAKGQAMNSTRVPPVNLINFAQTLPDGTTSTFTSKDIVFEYQGVVSATEGSINGVNATVDPELAANSGIPGTASGTRYAAYTIESINLEGFFKIFNGYGAHTYGSAVNGLSFFANWGVGEMPENNVYAYENAQDGTFVPLSGGGAKVDAQGSTARGVKGNDSGGADALFEDNAAGKYINFPSRSYVWKATFYYALEDDHLDSDSGNHYPVGDSNESYLNTGRDYSWIHFNFSNAPATLELELQGADRGKPVWSINAANDQNVKIHSYEVKVYSVGPDGTYPTDASAAPETATEERYRAMWPAASATAYELENGTFSGNAGYISEGTSSVTRRQLPVGRYIAVMTYTVTLDDETTVTRVLTSNIITVFTVDVKPVITVRQQMNGAAYTFDAVIRTNVRAIYEDYMAKALAAGSPVASPADFRAVLTVPYAYTLDYFTNTYVDAQAPLYVEDASGSWVALDDYVASHPETSYTRDRVNQTLSITFGPGTFSSGDEDLEFPRVRVIDFIPLSIYDFTVTVPKESGYNLAEDKSATASLLIQAPRSVLTGSPIIQAHELYRYNFVWISGQFVPLDGASLSDGNTGNSRDERFNTASRWTMLYNLNVINIDDNGATSKDLTMNEYWDFPGEYVAVNTLPYIAKLDDEGNCIMTDQAYDFATRTAYMRNSDWESNANNPSEPAYSTVVLENTDLNAPRTGLRDKLPMRMQSHFEKAGVTGFKTDGERTAKDFVTISDNYSEAYGGANRIVEDAYIALELTAPSDGLHYSASLADMKMGHHVNSNFHPDRHVKSDDLQKAHRDAPGVKYVNHESHLTDLTEGRVWWASNVDPEKSVVRKDFEERYYCDFDGSVKVTPDNLTEPRSYWAGCPESVTDTHDGNRYIGSFDRIHHSNGLYGTRNHHVRKGWLGGEPISFTHFRVMFGSGIDKSTGLITGLNQLEDGTNPVFASENDANDYLRMLRELLVKGTSQEDSELAEGVTERDFAERAFLNEDGFMRYPFAMLRVCHVNHESWWASAYGRDVTAKWFGSMGPKEKNFEAVVKSRIKYPTEYYTPVAYDLAYYYPFINHYGFSMAGINYDMIEPQHMSAKRAVKIKVPERTKGGGVLEDLPAEELNLVVARSTGLVAFDETAKAAPDIATALEQVEADAPSSPSDIDISFDRASGIATVTASAPVSGVEVYDVSGKRFAAPVTLSGVTATADLRQLGAGVYTLRAFTTESAKAVKLRK